MLKKTFFFFLAILPLGIKAQSSQSKRSLRPTDVYKIKSIADAKISPDGQWVSYTVSSVDSSKNKRSSDIWMSSWDGSQQVQLTYSTEGESQVRWSPDNKYISFVSTRNGATQSQLYLLDRRGGEAKQLTKIKSTGSLVEYAWSPDAKKIALVIQVDPDSAKPKTPRPIYIDRYQIKKDIEGYLENKPSHIYLFDLATEKLDTITTGMYEENALVWSPDGKKIAFVSNRTPDPDRNENTDIYVVEAKAHAPIKALTTWTGRDFAPVWSPDGSKIAYLRTTAASDYIMYDQSVLSVVDVQTGINTLLSTNLDRPVNSPKWSKDGTQMYVTVTDDRERYLASYSLSGQFQRQTQGQYIVSSLESHPTGSWLAMVSTPQRPAEIYAIEQNNFRRITTIHEPFFSKIQLADVEGFSSKSKDGTLVSNILYRAVGKDKSPQPTIFFIHGGPVAQDEYSFDLSRQMLAAAGYNVVAVNYRGSNGRGLAYCQVISGDWGNKEVLDILGSADYVVKNGIADATKLGIGGWSYGGILTDYTIATDTRFKAAASGAGVAMISSMYGVDQYILQYEHEIGSPWKHFDKYVKLSYPFLKADKIKTPTQFMVGESDHNVPAVGSEQMYQALKVLGIPTELIVYPNQFHGITVPSYQVDRFERYIKWFDKYLK